MLAGCVLDLGAGGTPVMKREERLWRRPDLPRDCCWCCGDPTEGYLGLEWVRLQGEIGEEVGGCSIGRD